MADPVTSIAIIAGVGIGSKVAGMNYKSQEADAAEAALELQSKQQTVAYQQKTLSNFEITERVLDRQVAQATTRGIGFSSPSFNAIQRNVLNISAKEGMNLEIEEALAKQNIAAEKLNVRRSLAASLFGDIFDTASSIAGIYSGMPKGSSGKTSF